MRAILKTAALILPFVVDSGARAIAQAPWHSPVVLVAAAPLGSAAILKEMTQSAAVIFVGEVLSIRRPAEFTGSASSAVEIVFRVDQAVKGCSGNTRYTLREWAGLWSGGAERYRPGQRLLMFLRASGSNWLSSPVHGTEGAIPLRGGGAAPGPDDANPAAADWLVDLRWLQAQVPRNQLRVRQIRSPIRAATTHDAELSSKAMEEASASKSRSNLLLRDGVLPWRVKIRPATAETAPLSKVLDLCRSWIEESNAAR